MKLNKLTILFLLSLLVNNVSSYIIDVLNGIYYDIHYINRDIFPDTCKFTIL